VVREEGDYGNDHPIVVQGYPVFSDREVNLSPEELCHGAVLLRRVDLATGEKRVVCV
jgi:hypothetical protein